MNLRYEIEGEYTVGYDEGGIERERFITTIIPPEPAPSRFITVGALYDRLGAQKYPILSSDDPVIKAFIIDCTPRKYIDLARADLLGGLQLLVSKGFPVDPEAIVGAPIQDVERP